MNTPHHHIGVAIKWWNAWPGTPPHVRGRREQLDGLRAIAVFAVILCHTLDPHRHSWSQKGAFGVQLFFVLSGFLITGILMDARRDATDVSQPMGAVVRAFYVRRVLRIFPVYYVTLAVAAVMGIEGMREDLGWNLTYLSNWRVAIDGKFGAVTHIWSLAVEEQFYVLWPLVVLFAPKRILPWAIASMIALASATRVVLTVATDMWSDGIAILTPSVLDSLGLGALLAFLWRSSKRTDRAVNVLGVLAVVMFIMDTSVGRWGPPRSGIAAFTVLWWSLAFVWVVHRAAVGRTGAIGRVLTFRPLAYIGTISYGIYLFHLFVVPVATVVERRAGINLPVPVERGPAQLLIVTVVSIALAALSWRVLERPINSLKHRFPYVVPAPNTAPIRSARGPAQAAANRDVQPVCGKRNDRRDAGES
jgi:peptidoglycan/LPS O-acetylase OafA/YrhL